MTQGWSQYPAQGHSNGNRSKGQLLLVADLVPSPPPPTKPKRRRVRLERMPQVRREMARTYKAMQVGELDVLKGTKLIYALEVLSRTLERENVEKLAERLDAVEGK